MKRLLIVLSFLLLALPICLHAQRERRDGNWWNGESRDGKLSYITGFFDGMELGHEFSYWGMKTTDKGPSSCMGDTVASYEEYGNKFFSNVTNSQLVDGVDNFYKDYRNRSIRVHDAVWLAVNSIAGKSQRDMDTMIEGWRKAAAKSD